MVHLMISFFLLLSKAEVLLIKRIPNAHQIKFPYKHSIIGCDMLHFTYDDCFNAFQICKHSKESNLMELKKVDIVCDAIFCFNNSIMRFVVLFISVSTSWTVI